MSSFSASNLSSSQKQSSSTSSSPKLNKTSLFMHTNPSLSSSMSSLLIPSSSSSLQTPSQIIKEAREKLHESKQQLHRTSSFQQHTNHNSMSNGGAGGSAGLVRTLNSTRPFTPREEKRSLFGAKSTRHLQSERVSYSPSYGTGNQSIIGSKSFYQTTSIANDLISSSRPLSASTRLSPIDTTSLPNNNNSSRISSSSSSRIRSSNSTARLAPLDVTSLSFNNNNNNTPSAAKKKSANKPTTTATATTGSQQEDINSQANWLIHIQPLLNTMESYFKGLKQFLPRFFFTKC